MTGVAGLPQGWKGEREAASNRFDPDRFVGARVLALLAHRKAKAKRKPALARHVSPYQGPRFARVFFVGC